MQHHVHLKMFNYNLVEPKTVKTPLERWELSLHSCTSFSQLYVHLALLGNSHLASVQMFSGATKSVSWNLR